MTATIASRPPTCFEWLTVAAIFIGPIAALMAQRFIDFLRERTERRTQLFFTLMATRATQLAPDHIKALNSIDVVFNRKKDKGIRDAWSKVLEHLIKGTEEGNNPDWQNRLNDLKIDLYHEIGNRVGYVYSIDYLKRNIYYPLYYQETENDLLTLRKTLLKALNEDGLKITLPRPDEPLR